jgi:hypothetical protein
LAAINKIIADEKTKASKAGIFESEAATKEYNAKVSSLKLSTQQTQELKKQNEIVKSLADAYDNDLVKSIKNVIASSENLKSVIAMGNKASVEQSQKAFDAQEVGVTRANAAILATVSAARAEEYKIYKQLQQDQTNLDRAYYENSAGVRNMFAFQQVSLEQAKNALIVKSEMDLYNLRVKLAQDEIAMNATKHAMNMSAADAYYLKTIGGEKAIQEAAKTRAEFEKKSTFEKTQFGIEAGAQLFSALGAQNKQAFEAAKAFNIANAIMNTYMAATKALASYPPPFSFIAAAAAVGMGMAQVAAIRGQTYSGRALGGPVMGGTPYMVGENGPELFTPNTTGNITRNQDVGGSGPVSINFNIQANDAQGFDDLLIKRRGMIQQFVRDAMTDNGQRSKM